MNEFIYALPSHNRAADYRHIQVTPTTGAIGADVEGLDLKSLSEEGYAELRQALLAHKVVFIREQELSPADLERVTQQFGEFGVEGRGAVGAHPSPRPGPTRMLGLDKVRDGLADGRRDELVCSDVQPTPIGVALSIESGPVVGAAHPFDPTADEAINTAAADRWLQIGRAHV